MRLPYGHHFEGPMFFFFVNFYLDDVAELPRSSFLGRESPKGM